MERIIGLKQFREDIQKIAQTVAKGHEYLIVKRSRPLFRIVPASAQARRPIDLSAWRKLAGVLKGKKIEDPVKWQKRIRAESERNFDFPQAG